jgi:O-antigen/teichoic acid export membrane protein
MISLVSGLASPTTVILVRNSLIDFGGLKIAGSWEALSRLSGVSLTFFTTMLGSYLVPAMSSLIPQAQVSFLRKSLIQLTLLIIPIVVFINIFSESIILFLFSKDFLIIDGNIFIQTCGDYVKGLSLLFSYYMITNKMMYRFVAFEIGASVLLIILTYIFINSYGFIGVSYAYFLTYLIYLIICYLSLIYFRK